MCVSIYHASEGSFLTSPLDGAEYLASCKGRFTPEEIDYGNKLTENWVGPDLS